MAAFQVEMGRGEIDPNSDWFAWVHDKKNIKNGLVSGDLPEDGPGFWELYASDLKLAREELGSNAIRLSMDWSRIFPSSTTDIPAKISLDGQGNLSEVSIREDSMQLLMERANKNSVKRYRAILEEARKLGLTVMLTLYHWPLPL